MEEFKIMMRLDAIARGISKMPHQYQNALDIFGRQKPPVQRELDAMRELLKIEEEKGELGREELRRVAEALRSTNPRMASSLLRALDLTE